MEQVLSTEIKSILLTQPANTVVTAKALSKRGFDYSSIHRYDQENWLKRIGQGAYARLSENPDINGAIFALQNDLRKSTHLGGLTALTELYGKVQYATNKRKQLFSYQHEKLPSWFLNHYKSIFQNYMTDFLPKNVGLEKYDYGSFSVNVSSLERAILEMLYLVPKEITVNEAFQIMETVTTLKPKLAQSLLEQSTSIKTNRLFFCFAKLCEAQWYDRIDKSKVELGNGIRQITSGGKLYSEFQLVLPEGLEQL